MQVLTGAASQVIGGLDMIWLSSPDLGALPKLSSIVLNLIMICKSIVVILPHSNVSFVSNVVIL
jgi:hypothetical protein